MKLDAVITGDVVGSTQMTKDERDTMLAILRRMPELLSPICEMRLEMFRGDGFQIGTADAKMSLRVAIAIRANMRSFKFSNGNGQWDARLSIGIGSVDYESDTLASSDGEAFRLSGHGLDGMTFERLVVETPWAEMNDELRVSTAFADNLISSWSPSQSRIIFQNLLSEKTHAEIGRELGVSRQMVDKSLNTSRDYLIKMYLDRFKTLINHNSL